MTYGHRDRRHALVRDAIDAVDARISAVQATIAALVDADPQRPALQQQIADLQALRTALDRERAELADTRWDVADANARAVATDWLWATPASLHDLIKADRAIQALERDPLLTSAAAAAIDALPRTAGDPRPGFLDEVSNAASDDDALEEVIGVALANWLNEPAENRVSPFREIGVLLPLRLETLFDPQPGGVWQLSIRVVPDEPSIRRDQTTVAELEAEYLDTFWARSHEMQPTAATEPADWVDHEKAITAWEQLADRVGSPRAAWLVTEFPPLLAGRAFKVTVPQARIGTQAPERVAGLPSILNIVAVDNGGHRLPLGTLAPDASKLMLPPLRKDATPPRAAGADAFLESWLVSWEQAKAVGMGGEFGLPAGCTPDTIAALYVYGIGDDSPLEHFRAHASAGVLGLLRLGAATNSVQGAPAADLATDRETWRAVAVKRLRGERHGSVDAIGAIVCGDAETLSAVPGASADLDDARRLVHALWPALWGHFFRDLWTCADDAHTLGLWAMDALCPEGPLLPIRIGTQPYGLLPVTSLDRWRPADQTALATVEEQLVAALLRLRESWSRAAEQYGTIVDADETRLLELLARTGVSARYVYRPFLPAEQLAFAYPAVTAANFITAAEREWRPAAEVMRHHLSRAYLAIGHSQSLDLPLIGATRVPVASLLEIFQLMYGRGVGNPFQEPMRGVMPDSLLIRLLIYSVMLGKAWYVQAARGIADALLNKLHWDDAVDETPLEKLQDNFVALFQGGAAGGPVARLIDRQQKAIFDLASELDRYRERSRNPIDPDEEAWQLAVPEERRTQLERALRATLDTAGHRIDPWVTGVAWRRARQHGASSRRLHRLGAYGWVDGPFRGTPGPNEAGRLHAPSHAQALTSVILCDKFLSSQHERGPAGRNIWQMDLTSNRVRLAIEMADEVRLGFHIFEAVGRRVEGIVGGRDRVRTVRKAFPLRPERPDLTEVCQGLAALEGLSSNAVPGVAIDQQQGQQLAELRSALEVYSDLLIAEGVHQVVTGHPDKAADAMDAAAGFSRPPDFQFPRTPPSGYRLATSVMTVLRHRAPVEQGRAIELIDASLAAFLADRFGDAALWEWRATWSDDAAQPPVARVESVTLADLSLEPLDVVLVPEDFLVEAARMHLRAPAAATIAPPPAHRLLRQTAGALGTRPASLPDFATESDLPADNVRQSDDVLRAELFGRYKKTREAIARFIGEMGAAGVTDDERVDWLRRALGWGILGPADAAIRSSVLEILFRPNAIPAPADLLTLTQRSVAALTDRLKNTPQHEAADTARLSVVELARALAQLATPDGKLAITVKWPAATLIASSRLEVDAAEADLDRAWLSVVAAVRPALARVEAMQLEALNHDTLEPLSVWTNSPDNPWRTNLIGQNVIERKTRGITSMKTGRFVVAYGPAQAWAHADVALTLIDQFSEAIPMAERTTYAAFGFNAPAARAPQAILLAVPPRADRRLQGSDILQILQETRQLVHARAARPEDVTSQPLAPSMWFQAAGPLRLRLDTGTEWSR